MKRTLKTSFVTSTISYLAKKISKSKKFTGLVYGSEANSLEMNRSRVLVDTRYHFVPSIPELCDVWIILNRFNQNKSNNSLPRNVNKFGTHRWLVVEAWSADKELGAIINVVDAECQVSPGNSEIVFHRLWVNIGVASDGELVGPWKEIRTLKWREPLRKSGIVIRILPVTDFAHVESMAPGLLKEKLVDEFVLIDSFFRFES